MCYYAVDLHNLLRCFFQFIIYIGICIGLFYPDSMPISKDDHEIGMEINYMAYQCYQNVMNDTS